LPWYSQFGAWGKKETEEAADAKPDAPELGADDVAAWNFYWRTARSYVRDYGLMPMFIRELGMKGVAKEIFLEKVCAIHDMTIEKRAQVAREGSGEKSEIVMEGSENG
jgi:hypothetical protein